jgi:hypothetical protein
MLEQELLQSPIPVERHDLANGRWYSPLEDYWEEHFKDAPMIYKRSSTTFENVLDKGIGFHTWLGNAPTYQDAMDYANKRATIGTIVHDYCERLLLGTKIDFERETKWHNKDTDELVPITREMIKYIMSFMQFCEDSQVNGEFTTEATEICMFDLAADSEGNQLHSWAGTADWVVRLVNKKGEEERWIVDWKTGKPYNVHQLQLTSYKILWESLFPDYPIDGVACLYLKSGWRKAPNYTFKKYKCDEATWKKVVEVSDWANNNPVPSFPPDLPTTFTLVEEEEEQEQLKESA